MVIVIPVSIVDVVIAFAASYLANWVYDRHKKH